MPGPGRGGGLARLVLDRVGGGRGRGHQRGGRGHGDPGHGEVRSSGHCEVRGPIPREVRGPLPCEVRGPGLREVHLRVVGGDDLVILVAGGLQCAVVTMLQCCSVYICCSAAVPISTAVLQCLLSPGSGSRAGRTGTTRCRWCSQSRAINNYEDIYMLVVYLD